MERRRCGEGRQAWSRATGPMARPTLGSALGRLFRLAFLGCMQREELVGAHAVVFGAIGQDGGGRLVSRFFAPMAPPRCTTAVRPAVVHLLLGTRQSLGSAIVHSIVSLPSGRLEPHLCRQDCL